MFKSGKFFLRRLEVRLALLFLLLLIAPLLIQTTGSPLRFRDASFFQLSDGAVEQEGQAASGKSIVSFFTRINEQPERQQEESSSRAAAAAAANNSNSTAAFLRIQIAAIHVDNAEFPLSKLLFKLTLQLALEELERRLEARRVRLSLSFRSANTCSRQYAGAVAAEEYYVRRARLFILSGCDDAIRGVSRLASQWQVPLMTAAGFGADLNDKRLHKSLVRVAFSLRTAVEFLIKILKSFQWRRVNLIVDDSDANSRALKESIEDHVRDSALLEQRNSSADNFRLTLNTILLDLQTSLGVNSSTSTLNRSAKDDKWPNEFTESAVCDALRQSALFSRVNILLIPQQHLRRFMLSVYDQNMANGLYTFINMPLLLTTTSEDQLDQTKATRGGGAGAKATSYAASTGDNIFLWRSLKSARNREARQAFESLMSIYLRTPTTKAYVYFASKLTNLANTNYATTETSLARNSTGELASGTNKAQLSINPYSASFYDCLQIYGLVLEECLSALGRQGGANASLHARLIGSLRKRRFDNMVTGAVSLNQNADRDSDYSLDDLNQMTGKFQSVVLYRGETRQLERLARIQWSSDESVGPTQDTVDCQLSGTCAGKPLSRFLATLLLLAMPLGSLLGALLYLVYRRIHLESQLVDYWWKISAKDIELLAARRKNGDGSSVGNCATQSAGSLVGSSSHANQSSVARMRRAAQPLEPETQLEGARSAVTKVTLDTSAAFNSSAADVCYGSINLGVYKLTKVAIKPISKFHQSRKLMIELRTIKNVSHANLCRFVGIVVEEPSLALVSEFCPKGSLREFFQNESMVIDWTFKFSIINDILAGLLFLHSSALEFHGRLRSSNCLVSARFVVKLADFGLGSLRDKLDETQLETDKLAGLEHFLSVAPEHMGKRGAARGSKKGDVYSLGLLLYEIVTNTQPFCEQQSNQFVAPIERIVEQLRSTSELPIEKLGPDMSLVEEQVRRAREQQQSAEGGQLRESARNIEPLVDLMQQCWRIQASRRPALPVVSAALKRITRGVTSKKLLENLSGRMEQYTNNLEALIDAKLAALVEEKERSEELLYQFVPKSIASLLKQGQQIEPEAFDCVTVFYSDIVGFTSLSSESSPIQVIDFLSNLYLCFDETLEQYDIFKVDTIGDAYIVASGLPQRNEGKHVLEIARAALELRQRLANFRMPHKPGRSLQMRVGIHSGACVAGIVGGLNMPKYCVFGDTLATGKFMESSGLPMRIHITEQSKGLLEAIGEPGYKIEPRLPKITKDGIPFQTYWLEQES